LKVYTNVSRFYAFYFFAGINVLLVAFVWFFVPETKKVSLEEMDAVFGGANHVVGGAEMEHKDPARHQSISVNPENKTITEGRAV
jgi:hypothetical protein